MNKIFKILSLTPFLILASCSSNNVDNKLVLDEFSNYIIAKNNNSNEELTYTLTINYLSESGSKITDSHIDVINAGESFLVVPPKVSGYMANVPYVEGYMNENKTINVFYDTVSTWDGVSLTAFSGQGTVTSPYLIESAANLAYLASVESGRASSTDSIYKDKYFRLTNNIDLNDHEWKPIGTNNAANYARPFQGHFDGKNHLITGLYINKPTGISYGLFGAIAANATISNLNVEGNVTGYSRTGILLACINATTASVSNIKTFGSLTSMGDKSNSQYAGAIAGVNKGSILNSSNFATVTSPLYGATGGIAGTVSYLIDGCDNYGKVGSGITTSTSGYGGIAGNLSSAAASILNSNNYAKLDFYSSNSGGIVGSFSKGLVKSCNNYGAIYAYNNYVGGITGTTESSGTVELCANYGYLESTNGSFAGISGRVNTGVIKSCNNYYRVEGPGKYTSGIAGNCYGGGMIIESCTNYGNISGYDYVSGVCGYSTQDVKLCANYGTIKGRYYVTGIVAYLLYGRVFSCTNEGEMIGEECVGGIVGYYNKTNDAETYIDGCSNSGTINGITKVGGVVGHTKDGTVMNCSNSGLVNGSGSYVGGVVGHLTHGGTCHSSSNTGNVYGSASVGGVIGYAGANTTQYDNTTDGYINDVYSDTKVVGTQK